MNEAENSNSPDLFESNDSQRVSAQAGEGVASPIAAQALGEWETVNLPNALSVDAIPQALEQPTNAELSLQNRLQTLEQQHAAAINHIQTLEQQHAIAADHSQDLTQRNRQLANQVSQFETVLEQARKAMRLERRRWKAQIVAQMAQAEERFQAQAAITLQKEQTIADTQEQATKLLQELEQSHQIGQRQQILIQTLTEQLEASQEQVAQLERECAATQQRFDEQIQFVRQAETACRDLRSRLQRQQRYTLQFKAALEKCLDVSATQPEESLVAVAATSIEPDASGQLFAPKAQPVQPWSAQPAGSEIEAPDDLYTQIEAYPSWSIAPAVNSSQEAALSCEPTSVHTESIDLEEPATFVSQPQGFAQPAVVSYTIGRSAAEADEKPSEDANHWEVELFNPQAASLPELEPAKEVGSLDNELELTPDVVIAESSADPALEIAESDLDQKLEAALQTFDSSGAKAELDSSASQPATDFLWNDLEALIETPTVVSPELPVEPLPTDAEATLAATSTTAAARLASEVEPSFITPFEQVMIEHFVPKPDLVPSATAFSTLEPAVSRATSEPEIAEVSTSFQGNGPSPIVYPLRSSKKLKSLAAVDLPSFPRRGN